MRDIAVTARQGAPEDTAADTRVVGLFEGESLADERRGVIEQHDHGAFGGAAIVRTEIGKQIGASQCARRFGPLAGKRSADPVEELTNYHDRPTLQIW